MAGPSNNASAAPVPSLNSIDDLVQHALKQTGPLNNAPIPNGYAVQTLLPALKKLDKSGTGAGVNAIQICTSALKDGKDALDVLVPDIWTPSQPRPGLAAAYVLTHRLQDKNNQNVVKVWAKAIAFCQIFDCYELVTFPQLYGRLAEGMHQVALSANLEDSSIQPLSELFQGYTMSLQSRKTLTSVHPVFARACLSTRDYSTILPLLDGPVEDINMHYAPVTIRHHLLFHYYAGCILAAAQRWSRACAYFETAVTVPGSVASAISLDAYKKLTLCSLIRRGAPPTLPKFTSQPVSAAFKSHCAPYGDLAAAFVKFDGAEMHKIANDRHEGFNRDGNWGLVLQCLDRLKSQAILKLRETFVTVSLQEVAEAVQGGEEAGPVGEEALIQAETLILSLVKSKELFASIEYEPGSSNAADATVTFLTDPEPFNSGETINMLTNKLSASAALGLHNADLSQRMLRSKDFLKRAMINYGSGGSSSGPGFYGGSAMEEDLLGEMEDE